MTSDRVRLGVRITLGIFLDNVKDIVIYSNRIRARAAPASESLRESFTDFESIERKIKLFFQRHFVFVRSKYEFQSRNVAEIDDSTKSNDRQKRHSSTDKRNENGAGRFLRKNPKFKFDFSLLLFFLFQTVVLPESLIPQEFRLVKNIGVTPIEVFDQ